MLGQHSGVMDETKDFKNYQDFLIMKNMGKLKDLFRSKTLPLKFKEIIPKEKYLTRDKNPPKVKINFTKILII